MTVTVRCHQCQRSFTTYPADCSTILIDRVWHLSVPCLYCGEQIIREIDGWYALLLVQAGAVHSDLDLEAV